MTTYADRNDLIETLTMIRFPTCTKPKEEVAARGHRERMAIALQTQPVEILAAWVRQCREREQEKMRAELKERKQ
jgi:hypothetical protein